jgi:hypothetical protein
MSTIRSLALSSFLIMLLTAAVLFVLVSRPRSVIAYGAGCLLALVCFYALLVVVATWLRHPTAAAGAWIAIRLVAFLPFWVAASLTPGTKGFTLFAFGFFPDAPFSPFLRAIEQLRQLVPVIPQFLFTMVVCAIYIAWYGGGGYLVGLWAQRRFGDRVTGKTPK